MQPALAIAATVVFVLVHLLIGRLKFISGTPRSRWLSIAGGVSVAYVFLHLLPELGAGQRVLAEASSAALFAERHVYLIALLGLVVFYGLERLAVGSCRSEEVRGRERATSPGVYALHILSFAVYNGLIGYLLLRGEHPSTASLAFFALAMGLHFLVSDYGLREHHKARYERTGRWLLSAAVVSGLVLGWRIEVAEPMIVVLVAFLAGGVVLNVMKEELPRERESRFSAFLAGAAVYTALLLAA